MLERQVFGALVRTLGLVLFYHAIISGIYALAHLAPIPVTPKLSFAEDFTWTFVCLALAAAVFFGADVIVRFGYGPSPVDLKSFE